MNTLTTADLVSFGNYLLSDERRKSFEQHPELGLVNLDDRLRQVHHADIENWKQSNIGQYHVFTVELFSNSGVGSETMFVVDNEDDLPIIQECQCVVFTEKNQFRAIVISVKDSNTFTVKPINDSDDLCSNNPSRVAIFNLNSKQTK